MRAQELIGGIEILILQQVSDSCPYVSDSGIGINFRFPTLLMKDQHHILLYHCLKNLSSRIWQ